MNRIITGCVYSHIWNNSNAQIAIFQTLVDNIFVANLQVKHASALSWSHSHGPILVGGVGEWEEGMLKNIVTQS